MCLIAEALLTQYIAKHLTDFHQTYNNDAFWDTDERCKFWNQKVKVQSHGGGTTCW